MPDTVGGGRIGCANGGRSEDPAHLRQHQGRVRQHGGAADGTGDSAGRDSGGRVRRPRGAACLQPGPGSRSAAAAAELREQIAAADSLLFCTPEYAGTLPGSLKNLLDWTVGGGEIYGKPVAWINVAVGGRGRGAEDHLAMVLRYVGAVAVERACARVPVPRDAVGPDGIIGDPAIRAALSSALSALADHAQKQT